MEIERIFYEMKVYIRKTDSCKVIAWLELELFRRMIEMGAEIEKNIEK